DYSHSLPWLHTKLTEAQVAFILQISFRSLTKSDAGRAVRNRMTLREIAQIINEPGIGYKEVCAVLNVFRLPDNTFVRPFLDPEDVATEYLHPDTVLDITHESLIRNWQSLIAWQKQEYSDYKNYTDFRVQLERWVQNEKSVKYLLGSGALSHYQDWYGACKPNRYWIAKYNEEIISVEAKISSSSIIAGQIIEFLGESAQHIMRSERLKRRTRIAFYVSSLVTIVVLSALSFWAFREKMNAEFQQGLAENQSKIAESETQKAITANGIAVQERENAEQNAKKALEAENLALQAKEEAEKQRGIAVAQSEIAKDAAQNAFKQRNIAQAERENAEKQRSKAEEASTKAEQLSFLSLAQALAYKAQNNFSDPQLNLLLANQAYLFHTLNGGEQNNPIINTGLRMALRINNYDNHFDLETKKVVLAWGNTGGLGFLAKNGDQGVLELATDKVIKGKTIHTIDIERAFRLTKSVCFGTQDGQILLLPDGSQNTLSLPSDKTLLRGAVLLPNDTYAYISRSGLLQVWNQSTMKVVASVKIQGLPTSLRNKENNLYVSTNEGRVYKWAVGEKTATEIYNANQRINLMEVSTNNIVLALASGKLDLLDLISYKYVRTGVSLPLPIQNFKYDPTTRTLAIEDGASVIRVYNIDRISESPLLIFEHGNKVRQLFFDKGRLYALLYNDKLFFWELEAKVYAGKITEQLSRTFTQEEWETLVSKTIPSGSTKTVR
ncbi:MAG: putative rane protein, partial [Bacteroidota bacterium]